MIPKKTKYKKYQKGHIPNKARSSIYKEQFGAFSIKATEFGFISEKQIEAARKLISKKIKNKGKLWVVIFAHLPKTAKPVEVRMGKGKGSIDLWLAKIKAGDTLYQFDGINLALANEIEKLCAEKLSVKCKLVCVN